MDNKFNQGSIYCSLIVRKYLSIINSIILIISIKSLKNYLYFLILNSHGHIDNFIMLSIFFP